MPCTKVVRVRGAYVEICKDGLEGKGCLELTVNWYLT